MYELSASGPSSPSSAWLLVVDLPPRTGLEDSSRAGSSSSYLTRRRRPVSEQTRRSGGIGHSSRAKSSMRPSFDQSRPAPALLR